MDHPDAGTDGFARTAERNRTPPQHYRSRIGPQPPEEHVHQGCFTGPVFPCDGVDLSLGYLEGNVPVRIKATEFLGNIPEFDHA